MSNPWEDNIKAIGQIKDFSKLCRLPVILKTMFVGNNSYIDKEYKWLVSNEDFTNKWKRLLIVNGYGNPERYTYLPETSGNTIHMVYHLAMWEHILKMSLHDVKTVYEFGGGFGNMAEIVNRYTSAEITIHDFPECSRMQKDYLSHVAPSGIFKFVNAPVKSYYDLFISTWAISECDIPIRETVEPIMAASKYILIAYAAVFHDVNNNDYFNKLRERLTTHSWEDILIPSMDGNHRYLFGRNFYI